MKPRYHLILILVLTSFSPLLSQDTRENADFKLAVNLYNDKLYDLALEQFRQFVATYPNTQQGIEARFYLGLCQTKQGKFEDARLTFQNFALAFPDHPRAPEAWWSVAESYVSLNNLREAALAFERVKTFHPKSKLAPGALMKASEYFGLAGDAESARKVLRTVIQDYVSSDVVLPARLKLAQTYLAENQYELARAEAKRVADGSKDPNQTAQGLVLLARALTSLKKYEEAQRALNEVVKNHRSTPTYYDALLFLGSFQREFGEAGDAIASWKLIDSDSARAPAEIRQQALIESGDTYRLRGDVARALSSFEKAGAIAGKHQSTSLLKGALAAEHAGDLRKARGLLAKIKIDSVAGDEAGGVLIAAARIDEKAGNYSEAIRSISAFLEKHRQDKRAPALLLQSANLYREHLKDYPGSITRYDDLIDEYPTHSLIDDALFGKAEALRLSGAADRSLDVYEDLLKRFPASDFAEAAKEAATNLRTYELKNKEAGLEKLALLVGDVIAQQSRADLAFRLGEIYFHDLRDYAKAADQYASALQLGLSFDRRASAWYYQARAYHSGAVQRRGSAPPEIDLAVKAIAAYDSLQKLYPNSDWAQDALTSQLDLRMQLAAGAADVRATSTTFLQVHPSSRRKDLQLFIVGEAFRKKQSFEDAARSYRLALMERPLKDVEPGALFRLGESFVKLGQPDTAVVMFREYLKKYPNSEFSAKASWALAQQEADRGNLQAALALYRSIEKSFPYTSYAGQLIKARGDACYKAGEYGDAVLEYQELLRENAAHISEAMLPPLDVIHNLAECYRKLGNRGDAQRYYAYYLVRDDSSERAGQVYYQLASIAREENNVALAARYLQRASQFSSGGTGGFNQAAFEAAELYFKNEEYSNAITRYGEAVQSGASDSLRQYVQSRIVVSYFRLNNAKEADARAAAFLKVFPRQARYAAEFELERGLYLLRKDDYVNARRHFDNVIQQFPTTPLVPNALYGNARVAESSDKTAEAIRLYESVIQRFGSDPIAPRARLSLGNLYYGQEQWDAAARQYKEILDNESRSPDLVQFAMNNLILAYKQLSLFDGALDLTRKYIERFPDDQELINKRIDIGVLYQRLGYYDQSVLHLQTLLESADAETEAEVRYYIGEAYYYKGDYQQSILEFLKVPYLVAKKTKVDWAATSYYMAGQAYEKMSKFDQAITMYKQIISRPGVDATFKTGAQREIDSVNALLKDKK